MKLLVVTTFSLLHLFSCQKKIELASEAPAGLSGSWNLKESCKKISSSYVKMKQNFTQTTFDQTANVFTDSSCLVPSVTLALSGNYAISNVTVSISEEHGNLDSTLLSYLLTPNSSSMVSSYNSTVYCGFTNWQLGVAKNVLGLTCAGYVMPSAGAVEFNFYTKANQAYFSPIFPGSTPVVSGDLYFGTSDSTHDGKSASQRYVVGDLSYIYVK